MKSEHGHLGRPHRPRRRLPRSFKELTPTKAFNPRTFFYEMVWKVLLTRRKGQNKKPVFPKLNRDPDAEQALGRAPAAGRSPRLRRVCSRTPGAAHLPRR